MKRSNTNKKKILGKHFLGMISIFSIVIITVLTFVSFVEDALQQSKEQKNGQESK